MADEVENRLAALTLREDEALIREQVYEYVVKRLYAVPDWGTTAKELARLGHGHEKIVAEVLLGYILENKDGMGYLHFAFKLCKGSQPYGVALEKCFVERCKKMQEEESSMRRIDDCLINKVSHVFALLLRRGCLPWRTLAHVLMEKKDMSPSFATFARAFFKEVTESDEFYFLEMIVEPDVMHSIESMYPERGRRDALFYLNYFDALGGFPWVLHALRMRLQSSDSNAC